MYITNYQLVFNGNKSKFNWLRKIFLVISIILNFLGFLFFISVWKYILHIIPLILFPIVSIILRFYSARLGFNVRVNINKDFLLISKIFSFSEKLIFKLEYNKFTLIETNDVISKDKIIDNSNLSDGFNKYKLTYQGKEINLYLDNYALALIKEFSSENKGFL